MVTTHGARQTELFWLHPSDAERENECSSEPLDAHYQTDLNYCLYTWLAVPWKSRELQCREVNICKNLWKIWVIIANLHLSFVFNKTPSFNMEFSPQKKTSSKVDFPARTWCSYTEQWETHSSKIQFFFPFALLCSLSFLFLPPSPSSGLHQGGAKEHKVVNPFQTGRFCIFKTGQNSYEQLTLEILLHREKSI